MMDWNDGYHWGWGLSMGIVMLLFWILVIGAVVLLVRWLVNSSQRANTASPLKPRAQELLDERLARGEISVAEYRERTAALQERDTR
jgi:putative membrane protein